MARRRRPELVAEAARRNQELLARLGGEVRVSRKRRRLTQSVLGDMVGVRQSTVSLLERGRGEHLSLDVWQRTFVALDRPLRFDPARDPLDEPTDARHLAVQELVLRSARAAGWTGTFELPIPAGSSRHSIDVGLRSDRQRALVVCEVWNTFGDVGAAARSFAWKLGRAEELAVVVGGERPYRVRGCWIVTSTRRNRELVRRYPGAFSSRFPGSSERWLRALTMGSEPPDQPGLLWSDSAGKRLMAWRRRSQGA